MRQHAAVRILEHNSPYSVFYENGRDPSTDPLPVPQFLRGLFEFDHFYSVVDASLHQATDDQMGALVDLPNLESLGLFNASECTEAGLSQIGCLWKLKQLDLFEAPALDDGTMESICSIAGLAGLKFRCGDRVTDSGLAQLARLPKLKGLDLDCGPQITNAGLAVLGRLSNLEGLSLELDANSEPEQPERAYNLAFLGDLKHLRRLSVSGDEAVADTTLSGLIKIPGLQSLAITAKRGITDTSLAHLAALPALEALYLDCSSGNETDRGLAKLAAAPKLRKLEIRLGPDVSDPGIEQLNSYPSLRRIKLHLNDRVTGATIGNLLKLEYLDLDFKSRSAEAPPFQLALPTDLEDLVIHGANGPFDNELAVLKALAKLHNLDLFWCGGVTDDGLKHIQRLPQLKHLTIGWCGQVTDKGISDLRASLPNCEVYAPKGGGAFGLEDRF